MGEFRVIPETHRVNFGVTHFHPGEKWVKLGDIRGRGEFDEFVAGELDVEQGRSNGLV